MKKICRILPVCGCFLLLACEQLPETDFYESGGVISARAASLAGHQGWEKVQTSTSVSLLLRDPEELAFKFFARRGNFTLWLLSQSLAAESDNLLFRIENEQGNLIAGGRAAIPYEIIRKWMSTEYTTEDLLAVRIPENGIYRLILTADEPGNIIIDKIHLTRNNEHPPFGFGYPETTSPNIDPVLERRDMKPLMPPANFFGVISSASQNIPENGENLRNYLFSDLSDLHGSGYLESPLKRVSPDDFDINQAAVFDGSLWLETVLEAVANQRLDVYEVPFLTADLTDISFTEEEWLRWVQFSAFNSLMYVPESSTPDLSENSSEIIDFYKNTRKELFPYLYSTAHLKRAVGMKPLLGDAVYTDQYMLGDALLVAPAIGANDTENVRLPRGTWYDFWAGTEYSGRQTIEVQAGINTIPVFVKAGSIIPFSRENTPADVLSVEIYGGGEGAATFRLYEDDGISTGYLQGEFSTTAFRYFEHEDYGAFTIGRRAGGFPGQPENRQMRLHFNHIPKPVSITAEGVELSAASWKYEDAERELVIDWEQPAGQKTDFQIIWE